MAETEEKQKVYVVVMLFGKKEDAENFSMSLVSATGLAVTLLNEPLDLDELGKKFTGAATLYKKNPDAPLTPEQREPTYIG